MMERNPLLLPLANEIGASHKLNTCRPDATSTWTCVEMGNSGTRLQMHGAQK